MSRLLVTLFSTLLFTLGGTALCAAQSSGDGSHEVYEVRSYILDQKSDPAAIDQYLSEALIPALQRQGIGPVGAFTNSENDETGSSRIIVVIPYGGADEIAAAKEKVESDPQYQKAAESYLARDPKQAPYDRIESELLIAMQCMPKAKVDAASLQNDDRVYELRIYESANERRGNLKVDMFNAGEVPIFLDSGIIPIFIGQAIVGPYTPNLTYLTVYEDEQARQEAWQAFRVHPDWKVLSKDPKYKGTVSKIHKFVLVPKAYSQM